MKHLQLLAATICILIVSASSTQLKENEDILFEENVDILASKALDPIKFCEKNCKDAPDKICVIQSSYGFPVRCLNMRNP